jgi:hypothetical protein
MQCTLSLIETSGIQRFIFGSNDLRENLGASELVQLATHEWAFETLGRVVSSTNVDFDTMKILNDLPIEEGKIGAEVIFAGGGGLAVLFTGEHSKNRARDFVYQLSRRVFLEAPGLALRATHVPLDFEKDSLRDKKYEAQRQIQMKPQPGFTPQLGLGVTVADTSTGWPTIGLTNRVEPASAQRLAKLAAAEGATGRLRSTLKKVTAAGYRFTDQLDQLGGHDGEENYVAIVHMDGNGMARRLLALERQHNGSGKAANRAYLNGIRAFSESLKDSATNALEEAVVDTMPLAPPPEEHGIYPVRPIVFGGDDITLVCDGSLGVALAVSYLQAFERRKLTDNLPGYATAGVAIVKTHYPFSRAYQLSEQLRNSARNRVVEVLGNKNGTAVDWHVTTTGILGSLDEIREREYRVQRGWLNGRPLMVDYDDKNDHRDWGTFVKIYLEFDKDEWRESRNKRVALREVLREDEAAVEQFRFAYGSNGKPLELPTVGEKEGENGWLSNYCLHFDALEALDRVRLEA